MEVIDMNKKAMDIALFRYELIAAALYMSYRERKKYFKKLAEQEHNMPHIGIKKYSPETLKRWLLRYKNGGLDNLAPSIRSDAGRAKRISEKTDEVIKHLIKEFPYLSISGIYRMLVHEGNIREGEFGETTLRNYIKKHNLKARDLIVHDRKKFEKDYINELWMADFTEGPYLSEGKKKRKLYLCGCIDDHSRVITGAQWFYRENSEAFALTLKKAFSIYGICDCLYTDNGRVFRTNYLHLICARLGIALIHSRPYDSPSRGKIERFFGTMKMKFISSINLAAIKDIEELNNLFQTWLDKDYHRQMHHGIKARPLDRYLGGTEKRKPRMLSAHDLDIIFMKTINRTVNNDAIISIDTIDYEVPVRYIGKRIELRFPIDAPDKIWIYEKDTAVAVVRPVNLSLNATKPYTGIHFNKILRTNEED